MLKSHQQSDQVCAYNLHFIIQNGTKKLKDHNLVRKHLFNYSNVNAENIQSNLLVQAGQFDNADRTKQNKDSEVRTKFKNDCFSYRSIRKTQSYRPSPQNTRKQSVNRKNVNNGSLKNSGLFSSAITPIKKRSERVDNKFIDLSLIMNKEKNGKKVTQAITDQIKNQEEMRNKKLKGDKNKQKSQYQEQTKQIEAQEKQRMMKEYFNKQLSKGRKYGKEIKFTTDLQGNIVYFDANENHKKSLQKQFPPSSINFSFDHQEEPQVLKNNYLQIKERAAKGEAFASAVLKTMNVSRISLNMGNTTNIDQYTYMKRNDLFNNNHSRQVTTIPFIQVNQGTSYKETNTNLSVSKKNTERTYHSQMKKGFKTHTQTQRHFKHTREGDKSYGLIDKINANTEFKENIKGKRSQSSRPYRPKSCIPYSAKSGDRITSFNEQLVTSLLE